MARNKFTSETAREAALKASPRGPGEKTKAWIELGGDFKGAFAERAKSIMAASDDETFMKYYAALIELFAPKLARTEVTGDIKTEITEIRRTVISKKV